MSSLVNGSYLVGRKLDGGVRRVARSGHLVVAAVACTNTQLQCNGCGSLHQHIANPMGRVDSRAMQAAAGSTRQAGSMCHAGSTCQAGSTRQAACAIQGRAEIGPLRTMNVLPSASLSLSS